MSEKAINSDELYIFAEETQITQAKQYQFWNILILDQDLSIAKMLNAHLNDIKIVDKGLNTISVTAIRKAELILKENEIAIVIINSSFLTQLPEAKHNSPNFLLFKFTNYIRKTLSNDYVRMILTHDESVDPINKHFLLDNDISLYLPHNRLLDLNFTLELVNCLKLFVALNKAREERCNYAKMITITHRFIPATFLKLLNKKDITEVQLTDHIEREMTVLFLDIRSFTSLSEFLSPLEVFKFFNTFLSYLQPCIAKNNGFIDKYIGDSVMALFPSNPDDAVKAGIDMLHELERYNLHRGTKYQMPVKIGVGINTGLLVMGVVGFEDRYEITVISDAVNTASRIEGLTKKIGASLIISEESFKKMHSNIDLNYRYLGDVAIAGKRKYIGVYEVFNNDPHEIRALKQKTRKDFEQAIHLYKSFEFDKANKLFVKVLEKNPHDLPAKYFAEQTNINIYSRL